MDETIEMSNDESAEILALGDAGSAEYEEYRRARFLRKTHAEAMDVARHVAASEKMWREDEDGFRISDVLVLSQQESEDVETLGRGTPAFIRYGDLRLDKGQSHNMAMILATGSGPTGVVKGSSTPCPNKPRPGHTMGGAKIENLKRKFRT